MCEATTGSSQIPLPVPRLASCQENPRGIRRFNIPEPRFPMHNAAVERRRDALSSAPRVHNEMTHMRRAHATV